MSGAIQRRSQCKSTGQYKDDDGKDVNGLCRQTVGESVSEIDNRHVRQHHAQRPANNDTEEFVNSRSKRDGDDLSLRWPRYRQVIIATHNANLVVNADAEQIIIAHNDADVLRYENGAIEEPHMREKICVILEGGEAALRQRELTYGLA
jgi:hypothetical protein